MFESTGYRSMSLDRGWRARVVFKLQVEVEEGGRCKRKWKTKGSYEFMCDCPV